MSPIISKVQNKLTLKITPLYRPPLKAHTDINFNSWNVNITLNCLFKHPWSKNKTFSYTTHISSYVHPYNVIVTTNKS